jgi:subtilisin family serine protease
MALRSLLPLLLAATTFAWPQDGSQPQCSGTVVTNKQTNAPHGLYQISHKDLHSGGIALNNSEYMFAPNPGKDTCAYVIDTGILPDHSEYATRVLALWDCLDAGNSSDATDGSKNYGCRLVLKDDDGKWPSNFDGNGHGTHTAGTVLGKTYGVAKEAKLIGIKVLDANGAGSTDDIKSAVRLAAKDAKERSQPGRDCTKGTACNLSLGSGLVGTVLSFLGGAGVKVVNEAADAGLFCAVAAGNSDALAEFSNPANEIKACTVGALNPQNYKACFSNYGEVVDVWAPGVNVTSAFKDGPNSKVTGIPIFPLFTIRD